MNKKNIKIIVILIIIGLIYGLLIFFLVKNNPEEKKEKEVINYDSIVLNNVDIWEKKDNEWYHSTKLNNNKKFNVYVDNSYLGNYYLKQYSNIKLYDDNKNVVNYNGNIFAYSDNLNINVKNYTKSNISYDDINTISSLVNSDININDLSVNEKIEIDLDSNGIIDKIISVSNLDALDYQEKYFNLLYVVLNNNIYELINQKVNEADLLIEPIYNIKYIINIDNNNFDSVVVQKGYFSNSGKTIDLLYSYENSKFKQIIND